jgi:hypothetical protein
MCIAGIRSCLISNDGKSMDQPIRTRRKDLPPAQPAPRPGTPPDPSNPDLDSADLDSDVINTPLPGDDAPAPDLDPPRERVGETVQPGSTGPETGSRRKP